ncbi:MAG TPA: hypothetical protein PLQ36_02520, partial [Candidatus Gracilibacteria bacterium]|nr:hypothetical protein [Candidatus Gracilibacteria bacterium]
MSELNTARQYLYQLLYISEWGEPGINTDLLACLEDFYQIPQRKLIFNIEKGRPALYASLISQGKIPLEELFLFQEMDGKLNQRLPHPYQDLLLPSNYQSSSIAYAYMKAQLEPNIEFQLWTDLA